MSEDTAPNPTQGQPPQAAPTFSMPEKFAGKSAEDIAKAYLEVEKQYGTASSKLGDLENYSKIGSPKDISEAIEWARNMKSALDRGLIVPAGQSKPAQQAQAPQGSGKPWEDESWAFKSPQEQYEKMYEYGRGDLTNYVNQIVNQYEGRIQQLTNQDARQKSILLKAITAAIKNPGLEPEQMLTEAATLATKSPEELIDMVLTAKANSPEALDKKVNEMVATKLAERLQEEQAKQLADITSAATPKPRGLVSHMQKGGLAAREAENRSIIDSLRKDGISLL